jgi:hypothetical protein
MGERRTGKTERAGTMLASMTGALFLKTIAATIPVPAAGPAAAEHYSVYGVLSAQPAAYRAGDGFALIQPRIDRTILPLRDAVPVMERSGFRLHLSAVGKAEGPDYGPAPIVRKDDRAMAHNKAFYPKAAPVVIGFRVEY